MQFLASISLDLTRRSDVERALPAETARVRELMQSGQIARLLEPALEQLSEMERVAFTLRHFEGCNVDEIARTLGVQQNAAKHSVFRAVQKLRRALEPAWGVAR